MNVYLAARYSRRAEMVIKAVQLQQKCGITVTSRWIRGTHEETDDLSDSLRAKFADEDLDDLRRSEVMIFFSEPQGSSRGGRHVELGYALALGLKIIMIGGREHIFSYLPQIMHVENWNEAFEVLYEWSVENREPFHLRYTLEGFKREPYS